MGVSCYQFGSCFVSATVIKARTLISPSVACFLGSFTVQSVHDLRGSRTTPVPSPSTGNRLPAKGKAIEEVSAPGGEAENRPVTVQSF